AGRRSMLFATMTRSGRRSATRDFCASAYGLRERGCANVALSAAARGGFAGRHDADGIPFVEEIVIVERAVATRILLVEHEPQAARALERLFARCGFSTVLAMSLSQARQALGKWQDEPCSYVFVDNKLADGEGVDLLPELRKLDPLPAVALVSNWMTSELA